MRVREDWTSSVNEREPIYNMHVIYAAAAHMYRSACAVVFLIFVHSVRLVFSVFFFHFRFLRRSAHVAVLNNYTSMRAAAAANASETGSRNGRVERAKKPRNAYLLFKCPEAFTLDVEERCGRTGADERPTNAPLSSAHTLR